MSVCVLVCINACLFVRTFVIQLLENSGCEKCRVAEETDLRRRRRGGKSVCERERRNFEVVSVRRSARETRTQRREKIIQVFRSGGVKKTGRGDAVKKNKK